MTELDYRAIAALQAVIENQGFEEAAKKLFITQSAVSQRIQSLENYFGKPVLIRAQPYKPTELGKLLLGHYKQLIFLEESLHSAVTSEVHSPQISIAISRDSLETWFVEVLNQLNQLPLVKLEVISDDQEVTLDYLKKGLVSACASTEAKPIKGCQAKLLGYLDYVLVASPAFIKKHFAKQKNIVESLIKAPAINFDNKDYLHTRYLEKFFNIKNAQLKNYHVIPSVAGFRQFAVQGYAYALIPEIHIRAELKQKKLINLFPAKIWHMPVYWHSWAIENKNYQAFNELVARVATTILKQ